MNVYVLLTHKHILHAISGAGAVATAVVWVISVSTIWSVTAHRSRTHTHTSRERESKKMCENVVSMLWCWNDRYCAVYLWYVRINVCGLNCHIHSYEWMPQQKRRRRTVKIHGFWSRTKAVLWLKKKTRTHHNDHHTWSFSIEYVCLSLSPAICVWMCEFVRYFVVFEPDRRKHPYTHTNTYAFHFKLNTMVMKFGFVFWTNK